jgi:hypothetical protein
VRRLAKDGPSVAKRKTPAKAPRPPELSAAQRARIGIETRRSWKQHVGCADSACTAAGAEAFVRDVLPVRILLETVSDRSANAASCDEAYSRGAKQTMTALRSAIARHGDQVIARFIATGLETQSPTDLVEAFKKF